MNRLLFFLFCFGIGSPVNANDGAYYASGNHLIPIFETDISVKKEILRITRINEDELKVVVEYEFYNPSAQKQLTVGFEAASPSGDILEPPDDGKHPYIRNFTVNVNGASISYATAIVGDSNYIQNGAIVSLKAEDVLAERAEAFYNKYHYVYYFDAIFKKGLNKIRHEYIFKISRSNDVWFSFDYILTAANRWANNQIDDFTLIIDLGERFDYNIARTFFDENNEWKTDAQLGKGIPHPYSEGKGRAMRVITREGPIEFKKKNFKPVGELQIYRSAIFILEHVEIFDMDAHQLSLNMKEVFHLVLAEDEASYKVLRNLPFARRGYIFKDKAIQKYYESMDWYEPNRNYKADAKDLSADEVEWLERVDANQRK